MMCQPSRLRFGVQSNRLSTLPRNSDEDAHVTKFVTKLDGLIAWKRQGNSRRLRRDSYITEGEFTGKD